MFDLHPRLATDCFDVGALPLCQVLLMNDARFRWCILVPRIAGLRDLHDVPRAHRDALFDEIERTSTALQKLDRCDKINVAALGNMVPQLHVHVIARTTTDAAWPGPVWGVGTAQPYDDSAPLIETLKRLLEIGSS